VALTFFGLIIASQAAFGVPAAALEQLASEWLRLPRSAPTTTPTVLPTAALEFGPTSAPGLAGPTIAQDLPSPTLEPSATAELAPSPTAQPPTGTTPPPPTPTETASLVPSLTPAPSNTPSPSPAPSQTAALAVTEDPSPTLSRTPTRTPSRTPTRTPSRTPTRTPTPSPAGATPSPTLEPGGSPPAPSPTWPAPSATSTQQAACFPSGSAGFESALLGLINDERQSQGLEAYSSQSQLQAAARLHAADMACNHFFSHTGSDGSTVGQRVNAQGYSWSWVGENIFATSNTSSDAPQQAFDWWMNSAPHRANLLHTNYSDIGLGYVYLAGSDYGGYFVAVFARP
jgi:uncharacterized protein YkwD